MIFDMSSYKLTYFNFGTLGDPIRLLLSYANIDFIDERFEEKDWSKMKHSK